MLQIVFLTIDSLTVYNHGIAPSHTPQPVVDRGHDDWQLPFQYFVNLWFVVHSLCSPLCVLHHISTFKQLPDIGWYVETAHLLALRLIILFGLFPLCPSL